MLGTLSPPRCPAVGTVTSPSWDPTGEPLGSGTKPRVGEKLQSHKVPAAVPWPSGIPGQGWSRAPGDPSRHCQLPSSSPRRAARPRQRCQPGSTSSINSLHTVHIDRLCSLPGAPPRSPPPRRLLHRWAAQPACCMIHTNSLTQGNQWARKSTRSKARSLSGDRPPSKETQRAAARAPSLPGAPRGCPGPGGSL